MGFGLFIGVGISGVGEYRGAQYGDYEEPRHSIKIEGDYLVIEVEVPGVNKENIIVKLIGDDELLIRAEGNGRKYLLLKQLSLHIASEGSQAIYRNGLLTVKLAIKGTRIGVE